MVNWRTKIANLIVSIWKLLQTSPGSKWLMTRLLHLWSKTKNLHFPLQKKTQKKTPTRIFISLFIVCIRWYVISTISIWTVLLLYAIINNLVCLESKNKNKNLIYILIVVATYKIRVRIHVKNHLLNFSVFLSQIISTITKYWIIGSFISQPLKSKTKSPLYMSALLNQNNWEL